jgi:TolB-like protein
MISCNRYYLKLVGAPALLDNKGNRVALKSRKGIALLALMATADDGTRSRAWLQGKLWGSRGPQQAQSSLRRELANLRDLLASAPEPFLHSDFRNVRLDLSKVDVDIRIKPASEVEGEFLEGLDIPGEEEFEDWLRQNRIKFNGLHPPDVTRPGMATPVPTAVQTINSIGFNRAAVAVMPLRVAGIMRESDGHLRTGIVHKLAELLSRLRWLPIISSQSSASPELGQLSREAFAQRLGARYVLETDFLRSDDSVVLTFSLLEMPPGRVVWAESRELAGPIDAYVLDLEVQRAVNVLAHSVARAEQIRAVTSPTRSHTATDLLWRANHHIQRFTRDDFSDAERLIAEAMALEPANSEVAILRAHHAIWRQWLGRARDVDVRKLVPLARDAIRADPGDARGHLYMGILDTWERRLPAAIRHIERSCELNPSFAGAHCHLGAAYYLNGEPEKGLDPLERALFLSPADPLRFFVLGELATLHYTLDRHDRVLEYVADIQMTHPNYILGHILKVASLKRLGRHEDAVRAFTEGLATRLKLASDMLDWIPFRDPAPVEAIRTDIDAVAPGIWATSMPDER